MIILGIDPDSDRHGVAIYENGKLTDLLNLTLLELVEVNFFNAKIIAIENVCANNGIFEKDPRRIIGRARSVGKLQQSQVELVRFIENTGIKIVYYKISKAWKKGDQVSLFKKCTGWTGRSNEDNRSAAYFGFQAKHEYGVKQS